MKYIDKMLEMGCFSRQDIVLLTGNESAAHSLLHDYIKKDYIERIRRDLYAAISFETKQSVANRFVIASHLSDDACVSHHSAFEYYGYANQVFYEVYVATKSRFSDFTYDGVTYRRVAVCIDPGVDKTVNGVRVTNLERTVIDSIHDSGKIGGLEELLRCLSLVPSLRSDKLIEYLDAYGQGYLYQKTGYVLMQFSEQLGLPTSFIDYCKSRISASKKYLYTEKDALSDSFTWHEEWRLYAPENLKLIINKGVALNV